jgi:large subunit ribosomal protein L24
MAAEDRKGDKVVVITGRDKGKQGEVLGLPEGKPRGRAGVNMVKRHTKPEPGTPGRHHRKRSADPRLQRRPCSTRRTGKPTRVGFRFLEDGRKVRFAKRLRRDHRSLGGRPCPRVCKSTTPSRSAKR